MNMRVVAASLVLIGIPGLTHSEVPTECRTVYREAGARPFDSQCFILSASASVDLGTYTCTAREEYITEYCNTLPPYEEADSGGDDSDDGGQRDEGDDAQSSEGEAGLPTYQESTETTNGDGGSTDSGDDCVTTTNPLPSSNGMFDFTMTQGWQFLDGPLSQYSNVVAIISLVNLADSVDEAYETGDSARMFENIYSIVFPLFPYDSAVGSAFKDFSDFADQLRGSEC